MRKNHTKIQRLQGGAFGLRSVFVSSSTQVFKTWGGKLLLCANDLSVTRFAVVLAKGFPSAVIRNRAKRWVREYVRQEWACFPAGWDMVFVLYFVPQKSASSYRSMVLNLLGRTGLVTSPV